MSLSRLKGPGEVEAEILMSRQTFKGSFLIVEGDDDSRFWRFRIHKTECEIVIGGGKPAVKGGISRLDQRGFKGALGIIDDDFDSLASIPPGSSNLISTDSHDLETMLLRSSAFEKLLAEHGNPSRIRAFEFKNGKTVREALLERGSPFGQLRWLSARKQMGISFKELIPRRFVDSSNWILNKVDLISTAANQPINLSADELARELDLLPVADPWLVCHGHDLIDLLAIGFERVLGNSKPGRDGISSFLRGAIDTRELATTHLWTGIQGWESANPPYIVLKPELQKPELQ